MKTRIEEVDILKALGIILMVAGHSGAPFTKFIYLFHMAIFFMVSGFLFKDSEYQEKNELIKKVFLKIKQLWVPFVLWTSIYVIFHNIFLKLNIYTDNAQITEYVFGGYIGTTPSYSLREIIEKLIKSVFFSCGEQIFGACWFIKVLFYISILYLVIDYFSKKLLKRYWLIAHSFLSILFLSIGFFCSLHDITFRGIELALSYYCLYFGGHIIGMYKSKYSKISWRMIVLLLFLSFTILLFLENIGSISLDQNEYVNPVFLLLSSLVGWIFIYAMSYALKFVPYIKGVLTFIGQRTLSIVILHFLCMKLVAIVVVLYYDVPLFCLAAFPCLYGNKGLWWIAYTIVGVVMPVMLDVLYKHISQKIFSHEKRKNSLD